MVKLHEDDLEGYEPIKGFNRYRVNVNRGLIINHNDKYLMHSQPNGKILTVNMKNDDGIFRRKWINVVIYDQVHDEPINLKTHTLKHRDGDMYNCSIDNLKKVKRGYKRKTPVVGVEIETLTGDEKGHIEVYRSVHSACVGSGLTLHYFKKALKNYLELDGQPTIVKDKAGSEFLVTIKKDFIDVQHADDEESKNLKFWKI